MAQDATVGATVDAPAVLRMAAASARSSGVVVKSPMAREITENLAVREITKARALRHSRARVATRMHRLDALPQCCEGVGAGLLLAGMFGLASCGSSVAMDSRSVSGLAASAMK